MARDLSDVISEYVAAQIAAEHQDMEAVARACLTLYEWDLAAIQADGVHWFELQDPVTLSWSVGLACEWPRPHPNAPGWTKRNVSAPAAQAGRSTQ